MMIRSLFSARTVLPVFAVSLMVACGGAEEEVAPSPTPTPVPPMDDYFRVTELIVLESDEGLDLNGDNEIDNNIEIALEQTSASIINTITTAFAAGCDDESEDTPCVDDTIQETILRTVETALESVFTVDAISEAINGPIESGDLNYLLEFKENDTSIDLKWYLGQFVDVQIVPTTLLGTQTGSLDAANSGLFGPGNLTLTLTFEVQGQGGDTTEYELPIVMYESQTAVTGYSSTEINDMILGGVISNSDLIDLVANVLEGINDAAGQDIIDVATITAALEEVLAGYSDYDIGGDGSLDGFSIGLGGQADGYVLLQ